MRFPYFKNSFLLSCKNPLMLLIHISIEVWLVFFFFFQNYEAKVSTSQSMYTLPDLRILPKTHRRRRRKNLSWPVKTKSTQNDMSHDTFTIIYANDVNCPMQILQEFHPSCLCFVPLQIFHYHLFQLAIQLIYSRLCNHLYI